MARWCAVAVTAAVAVGCGSGPGTASPPPTPVASAPEPGKPPPPDKRTGRKPDAVSPPRGVKHDIPGRNDTDYSKRPNWESAIRENCTDAGYDEDCLQIVYTFLNGKTGESIGDPGTGYYEQGFEKCTATVKPPVGKPPELKPGSTIRFLITCTPEKTSGATTTTGQPP